MDERELVLTSLIYPLIFREATSIGLLDPVSFYKRTFLKKLTTETEATGIGIIEPVSFSLRNLFQKFVQPVQDFTKVGLLKPHSFYLKNIFQKSTQPAEHNQLGIIEPKSFRVENLLQKLEAFGGDATPQLGLLEPVSFDTTCKPVVFAPVNLSGYYNGESIQLFWSNSSVTHTHQNLYRSTESFTESSLPPTYQYISGGVYSYTDEDIVEGVTYYYAVSTEAGLTQLVSVIIEVTAGGAPQPPETIGLQFYEPYSPPSDDAVDLDFS